MTVSTIAAGDWYDDTIWEFGQIPDTGINANIFHAVTLNTSAIVNDLSIISGSLTHTAGELNIEGAMFQALSTYTGSNDATITMAGTASQQMLGDFPDLRNLRILNTSAGFVQVGTFTCSGELLVEDGHLTFIGLSGAARNVKVYSTLECGSPLSITGNDGSGIAFEGFNGGNIISSGSTIRFTGSSEQAIDIAGTGYTFSNIEIANTAASPSDVVAVTSEDSITATGQLSVNDGQFMPATGSSFRNINVGPAGILKPVAGASISITGASSGNAFFGQTNGQFIPNGGKLRFTSSAGQELSVFGSGHSFYDIEVVNTAATPDDTNDASIAANTVITNSLVVTDGQLLVNGGTAYPNTTIGADGILKLGNPTSFAGNLTNTAGGSFLNNGRNVTFSGTGPQAMSGPLAFTNLIINNSAATPSDTDAVTATAAITATGQLSVNDGQFMPPNGSSFNNINVAPAGILKPVAGASIDITGSSAGTAFFGQTNGQFIPNGGKLRFTSSAGQELSIFGGGHSFYDIEVINTAATPDDTNDTSIVANTVITNSLVVTDGQLTVNGGPNYPNTTIGANGVLKLGGQTEFTGNLTKAAGGSFLNNGRTVIFNGNDPQVLDGSFVFAALSIDNRTATPSDTAAVTATGIITTSGHLTVADGQFMPISGSSFNNVSVVSSGILKPVAGATIDITGNNSGTAFFGSTNAQFIPNGGKIRLTSATNQDVSVSGSGHSFYDIEVVNTAAVPDDFNDARLSFNTVVTNSLVVTDGQLTVNGGADLPNTMIASGGILKLGSSSSFAGNLTEQAGGTFDANGLVANFTGTGTQQLNSANGIAFFGITVAATSILHETGAEDSSAASITNAGTIRRTKSIADPMTGGLTGVELDIQTTGTLAQVVIDRVDSVANSTAAHNQGISYTLSDMGQGGYTASLILPHALATPAYATVSKYLGTGTNWDYVQDAFTATTVTRNGITDMDGRWAVAEVTNISVNDWETVGDE
jgi:hypothetical protein